MQHTASDTPDPTLPIISLKRMAESSALQLQELIKDAASMGTTGVAVTDFKGKVVAVIVPPDVYNLFHHIAAIAGNPHEYSATLQRAKDAMEGTSKSKTIPISEALGS